MTVAAAAAGAGARARGTARPPPANALWPPEEPAPHLHGLLPEGQGARLAAPGA